MFIKINGLILNKNIIKLIAINENNNIIVRLINNNEAINEAIIEEHSNREDAEKAFNELVKKLT